ncbi:MAG: redox-regulated ATPase YchF [Clostridiales bacterium]|jgi:GTP-binding protein YchF|nr:redox-regulated ATPase YchF [Clostridiales bacterium]
MKLGIVGLPNVGKSTLFNAITKAGAESANYPFCTIEPNVGIATVPDERLDKLVEMYEPDKVTPAIVEFVDIAGLVKGASRGEGLGNKFLSHIREVDAILHVVRCFDNGNIVHVDGNVDPVRDIETIRLELIFADIEAIERRLAKATKNAKSGNKDAMTEVNVLQKIKAHLEANNDVRTCDLTPDERNVLGLNDLLTDKPIIYVANISDSDIGNTENNEYLNKVKEYAAQNDASVIDISAEIEEEIAALDDDDKSAFLADLGLESSGLDRLIKASYELLGQISYLTAGKQEVRAWTITKGTKAPGAAGKIHTDFERGFIRAEIVSYNDLMAAGSMNAAKEKGLVRSEGKEYVVQDGDVVLFRFNV